jgi:hypothetical protein
VVDTDGPSSTGKADSEPYAPSLVDRFMAWVEGLPGPAGAYYVALLSVLIVIVNGVGWIDGSQTLGSFDLYRSSVPAYPVFVVVLMRYLNGAARRALAEFRPALGVGDVERRRLAYGLTHLPARGTAIAMAVSVPFTVAYSLFALRLGGVFPRSPWLAAADTAIYLIVFALIAVFVYHTVHQLRMVSLVHASATDVSLFRRDPLYAFSKYTAQTGICWLLLNYFSIVTDPATFVNPALLGLAVVASLVALACFIVPLLGMQRRIALEKRRHLAETNARLEATIDRIHRHAREEAPARTDELHHLLTSLVAARDVVAEIPTWPWRPGTVTGFFTVFLLPLAVSFLRVLLAQYLI